jgi:hypothetical protein
MSGFDVVQKPFKNQIEIFGRFSEKARPNPLKR